MSDIFVLVEHRRGEIRDITFEMLSLGNQLASKNEATLTAILIANDCVINDTEKFSDRLKNCANKILCIDDKAAGAGPT